MRKLQSLCIGAVVALTLYADAQAQQVGSSPGGWLGFIRKPTICPGPQNFVRGFGRRGDAVNCTISGIQTDRFPFGGATTTSRTGTHFICPYGGSLQPASGGCIGIPLPFGGVVRDLNVFVDRLPSGNAWRAVILKNNTPTTLTCDLANPNNLCRNLATTVMVSTGDTIQLQLMRMQGASPTSGASWTVVIDP